MASADRIIEIFNEAKARPPGAERDHFLSAACGNEPAIEEQVLSLLKAHDGAGDFLRHTQLLPDPHTEKPGDRIGRYKLLEQIGEGGWGLVYMAEQEEPVRRRVALKVIKLGMDTKNVIARFEAERQALALMDHPNIARVLDAGATDSGRPFFVMELVRGIRITEYCNQNDLSTADRLGLFMQVCQAIQHAHQKGIIHRDIKPSNILVTRNENVAVPKVIDFGIAKATSDQRLTDKTVFTAFEQFIGTPAYMSPEQAMMTSLDIDTRTDIYALGVLLYELLTEQTPFDADELMAVGLDAMRRIIREEEPARPSTKLSQTLETAAGSPPEAPGGKPATEEEMKAGSRRLQRLKETIPLLRGDLDWIVMKALEKDRTRRYETATGLAADIQRHLNSEPVGARPPSNLYRFQKLVRRNKLAVASVVAVSAALLIGLGLSTWLFVRERAALKVAAENELRAEQQARQAGLSRQQAEANEKRAASEAAKSQQFAHFLKDMLRGVGPGVARGRDTALLREILDQTAERLRIDLTGQPEVEADLRETLGLLYRELGDYPKAATLYQDALEIRRKLHGNDHLAIASALTGWGQVLHRQNKYEAAETVYRDALTLQQRVLGMEHADSASTLVHLGSLLRRKGDLTEAEPLLREALSIRRKLLGNDHPEVAEALNNLGLVLRAQSDKLAEAELIFREALTVRRKTLGDDHFSVADTLGDLGRTLEMQSRMPEAEALCREALVLRKNLLGDEHPEIMDSLARLLTVLQRQGKDSEAEAVQRELLALQTKLGHPEAAKSQRALVLLLRRQSKWAEAEAVLGDLLSMQRRLEDGDIEVASTLISLGQVSAEQGEPAKAKLHYREALEWFENGLQGPGNSLVIAGGSVGLRELGAAAQGIGEVDVAERAFLLAVRVSEALVAGNPGQSHYVDLNSSYAGVSELFWQQNRVQESIKVIRRAIAAMDRGLAEAPGQRPALQARQPHNYRLLGFRLWRLGNLDEAREAFQVSSRLFRQEREGGTIRQHATCLTGEADNFHCLGKLADAEGKAVDAREAYHRALAIHERIEMENLVPHITQDWVDDRYFSLANLLRTSGTPEIGLGIARVMRTPEVALSPAAWRGLFDCHYQLAELLRESGHPDEAGQQLIRMEEVVERQKEQLGDEHPEVVTSLARLASALRNHGRLAEPESK